MRRVFPLLAVAVTALAVVAQAAAFIPTDPLAPKQWYLQDDHAFDAWALPPTTLTPVKVAIVDSGIDCSLPDFQGRIADTRSFVGGDPCVDTDGHGTFVAGIIAANLDTQGIVGIAYTSQLLIAKVVRSSDGQIPLEAEAAAIRWAADSGARVINLSLGGVRDPVDPNRDTFSSREASAIAYAYAKGALLVAAVGNGDEAPTEPWPFADYPAALPHVMGVSALTRSGNVPDFSDRDAVFNDMSAPGEGIFSTFPLALTAQRPLCTDQGFSDCGPSDYANPEGTSFAAPQVSAAAAVLFALAPSLTNDQVSTILEHTADDVNAASGCSKCPLLRDAYSGWGRVDVAKAVAALAGPLPVPDRFETNDDAGTHAHTLWGKKSSLTATLDYCGRSRRRLPRRPRPARAPHGEGERQLGGSAGELTLWRPGTREIEQPLQAGQRAAQSASPGGRQHVTFTARARGLVLRRGQGRDTGIRPVHAEPREGDAQAALAVFEQLVLGHVAQNARGAADDDLARRNVLRHDGARTDERLFADLDRRKEDRAAADSRAAADRRSLHELLAPLGAAHEVVVRRHHARRDEDVFLESRIRGDVSVGLDARPAADRRVVLDERSPSNDDVVRDRHALAHARLVAEDARGADLRAGKHDRTGGDNRALADLRRRQGLALRGRLRSERRLLADDGVFEHAHAFAEHRARIDRCGRVDLSHSRAIP